ncbi:hypothetical protein CHS0354_000326 [Potamilus streckersoni]|uniref:Uncharacterized protein n=1 Tax=Potamilus streckersoni TaxID=2493646 RepID=A0AAE0VUG9_9BIVA|nr:hypothetical protein CHS0354_000326 [Potamilus streckersoni]
MASNYIARSASATTTGNVNRFSTGNHHKSCKYRCTSANKGKSAEGKIKAVSSVTESITAERAENGIIDNGPLNKDTNVPIQSGVSYISELSHSHGSDLGTDTRTMYVNSNISNSTSPIETDMQVTLPVRERVAPVEFISGISSTKYTLIMFVVTLLFVVSFLPFLALSLWRTLIDRNELEKMTDKELNIYSIGISSICEERQLSHDIDVVYQRLSD